ncbi:MAG: TonB-dependent receptor plug domain-containing protein, partial [Tannerellaceae bacterium]
MKKRELKSFYKAQEILKHSLRLFLFTCLFLVGVASSLSAERSVFEQKYTLNLSFKNAKMEQVLDAIASQSGIRIAYSNEVLSANAHVTVNIKTLNIKEALRAVLGDEYTFKQIDDYIAIAKKAKIERTSAPVVLQKKDREVKGRISDAMGNPIIGANVVQKGTTNGVISDLNGDFILVAPENAIIQISYIGYNTKEVTVSGKNPMQILLVEDTELLDEVVVIGYGTVKKSDMTGAVGSVSMEKVSKVGITSADRALQGQIAGVQVNAKTGQPGEGMMIRVRGGNSLAGGNNPLYVIDGMPIENMSSDINPEDILSMEVLKDASSTAIYGSRGANGVVLITTKRGTSGSLSVDYNGYVGVSMLRKKLDLLGKDDYIDMINEVSQNDGKGISI